jgi:outer membrane protein
MRKQILIAAIAALGLSGAAVAHEPGDIILRAGVMYADPDVDNPKSIEWNGRKYDYEAKMEVKSDTQFGLSATYMILPHFGLELMASSPFTHKFREKNEDGKYTLGKVSRLSPTISAQYFFLNPKSKFQPYVGLGLTYNVFYDEKLSREMKADGVKSFKVDDSVGVAGQIGMDYKIGEHLMLNASIWKMTMPAKLNIKSTDGDKGKLDLDIDPWVYFIGMGYKF